ncbi:hypothetical protein GGF48_001939 [Coemansia sp. RSA 921]|nr:hypothetical protein GGF48_001939 [Coemansia sp. RSA 921]
MIDERRVSASGDARTSELRRLHASEAFGGVRYVSGFKWLGCVWLGCGAYTSGFVWLGCGTYKSGFVRPGSAMYDSDFVWGADGAYESGLATPADIE